VGHTCCIQPVSSVEESRTQEITEAERRNQRTLRLERLFIDVKSITQSLNIVEGASPEDQTAVPPIVQVEGNYRLSMFQISL